MAVSITHRTISPFNKSVLDNQHFKTLVLQPGNTKGDAGKERERRIDQRALH
jgi:hypothetical protein